MSGRTNRFSGESDSDFLQSLDLESEIAQDAHKTGNRKREDAAHSSINERLDEAERRGLFGKRSR
ncbi:hypothetical protein [Streptomyces sp. NPDC088258]|uniref:hypothetical protein n=1 Tax=Streptomyces sp. NPDC088258 TaxID=3365849 RepID=UPI00380C85F0